MLGGPEGRLAASRTIRSPGTFICALMTYALMTYALMTWAPMS